MGASQSSYDDEYDANDEYNEETEEMPVKVSVAWRGLTPKISPALMERIAEYMDDQKKESEESPQEEEEEQEEEQETAHSGNTIFGVMYDCAIGLRGRDSIDNMLNHEEVSGRDGE